MSSYDVTMELRAARPRAPEELRERVLALGEPEPRFSLPAWPWRRVALVAVPACLVVAVGAALIHGAFHTNSPRVQVQAGVTTQVLGPLSPTPKAPAPKHALKLYAGPRALPTNAGVPEGIKPNPQRLQDYRASLTVRVKDVNELSSKTQQAMRTTRALGGYVVRTRFDARKEGTSFLLVRVPIGQVQTAIARFSSLGTIVAQNISIADLTNRVDTLGNQIDSLRVRIAKIDDRLAGPLTNVQRVQLELQRARLARALHSAIGLRATLVRRAHLSQLALTLTTHSTTVATPHHRGSLGSALHDAGKILAKEAAIALYILIVIGPLALVAALIWIAVRSGRRYADRRLLESS